MKGEEIKVFFFQAEDGIRDAQESRGLGDEYKGQVWCGVMCCVVLCCVVLCCVVLWCGVVWCVRSGVGCATVCYVRGVVLSLIHF